MQFDSILYKCPKLCNRNRDGCDFWEVGVSGEDAGQGVPRTAGNDQFLGSDAGYVGGLSLRNSLGRALLVCIFSKCMLL